LISLVFLAPFSLNNFIQGRYLLGAGSFAIVAILLAIAFSIKRNRYHLAYTQVLVLFSISFLLFSVYRQGVIGLLWCYPALISFYFMLPERQAWLANGVLVAAVFPLAYQLVELPLFTRMAVTLLTVSAFSVIFIRIITQYQAIVEHHATTDHLTGLMDRTTLHPTLEFAIQQHKRNKTDMTLLTLDIDHFKQINDSYGHDAGDMVLRNFAEFLLKRLRSVDRVFRLGGEEFLVLLHDTNEANGTFLAQQICHEITDTPLLEDRPITISIGVATLQDQDDWQSWMKRSDTNLYQAKADGRNCVVA
jgi:diguanylate cyclase (GGDEF)-like protein